MPEVIQTCVGFLVPVERVLALAPASFVCYVLMRTPLEGAGQTPAPKPRGFMRM